MASALHNSRERQNQHRMSSNKYVKKSQLSPRSSLRSEFPSSSLFGCETVGESDVHSQRTAEVLNRQSFYPSETASEDSCSLRHKPSVWDHETAGNDFHCSTVYFSLDNLSSRAERKKLRKQLKYQLEQVSSLLSRVEARERDVKLLLQMEEHENNGSSSKSIEPFSKLREVSQRKGSVIHQPKFADSDLYPQGGVEGKRTSKANQFYSNAGYLLGEDMFSEKSKGGLKRGSQVVASLPDVKRQKLDLHAKKIADIMRQCGTILKRLKMHKHGWVFSEPVDVVKFDIPDYFSIIKKPMDLGTIEKKLHHNMYNSPLEFAEDVRLTFFNAKKYNPKGHDVHFMADVLLKLFESRWRTIDTKLRQLNLDGCSISQDTQRGVNVEGNHMVQHIWRSNEVVHGEVHTQTNPCMNNLQCNMTREQKRILSEMMEIVPEAKVDEVMQIIQREITGLKPENGEVTVDIDSLPSEVLWELYNLLVQPNILKQTDSGEITQVQPLNGVAEDSRNNPRGDDTGEEDIDIGVDMPTTNFPPVNIEKDQAAGSKCSSSSSSSSSDSGSHSSGSGSGSSSESDSEADDAQSCGIEPQVSAGKEPVGSPSGAVIDSEQQGSPTAYKMMMKMDDGDVKRTSDYLRQKQPSSVSSRPEGEIIHKGITSAPLQYQLSPEKQLRAALLKSRFADTILKAQEKTFPNIKGDNTDPEKLRRDRRELERHIKEQKSKLQAEAKAAESAQKKAEIAAASKARQQREAERQASRLLLQQMEKTVEIDESCDVLKDLAMLSSTSMEKWSSFISQEGQMVFGLPCNNALEQLGLFMKADDVEEEEQEDEQLQQTVVKDIPDQSGDSLYTQVVC